MNSAASDRHNYEYEVDLFSDTAPARVIRLTGQNRRVLEVGAGPGSITKHLIHTNGCDVVAVEVDSTAIEKLKSFCDRIYSLNLNDVNWPAALSNEDNFDVVIAADVLEHVSNPLQTLRGMTSLLREGGEIILSLPHVGHCTIGACLLAEDFKYQDWGLLDKTHVQFFGLKNINKLYEAAGLSIVEAQFVVRTPRQTEFNDIWEATNEKAKIGLLTNPHAFVYQVVTRAKLASTVLHPINLIDLPVEVNDPYYRESLVSGKVVLGSESWIRRYSRAALRRTLNPPAKATAKKLMAQLGIRP